MIPDNQTQDNKGKSMTDYQIAGYVIVGFCLLLWLWYSFTGDTNKAANITGFFSIVSTFLSIYNPFDTTRKTSNSADKYGLTEAFETEPRRIDFRKATLIIAIGLSLLTLALVNHTTNSPNSTTTTATTPTPPPTNNLAATKQVKLTNVASGIKVSWEKVKGAKYYKIYRDGIQILKTSKTNAVDTEVKYNNGCKYTYKVIASTTKDDSSGDSKAYRTSTGYRLMSVGIKSLKNTAAGELTVTYEKNTACNGYVIYFGLKDDMSDAKNRVVGNANTLSKTIGGLRKGKTYYVNVRARILDGKHKYYSGYSRIKEVRIEK